MSGFLPEPVHGAARMNRGAGPYVQACENKESPIYRSAFSAEGQGCLTSKERSDGSGAAPPASRGYLNATRRKTALASIQ